MEVVSFPGGYYIAKRQIVSIPEAKSTALYDGAGKELMEFFQSNVIQPIGPMTTIYYTWDTEKNETDIAIAFPVESELSVPDNLTFERLEPSKAVKYVHRGGYDNLQEVHESIWAFIEKEGYAYGAYTVELYEVAPDTEPNPERWITSIYYAIEE